MTQQPIPQHLVDASIGKRLGAFIVDVLIRSLIAAIVVVVFVPDIPISVENGVAILPFQVQVLFTVLGAAIFFIINGKLLAQHGQTIGKRLFNIRITHMHGSPVAMNVMVTRRYLLLLFADLVPLLSLANALPIFYKRRCLHDYLAGTRVIDLKLSR
ncbi:RDD family protein [Salinibius halmophilus]|uniref:RDD family protein n=1 Tax=Salinibius halmophilus TaxID=1853216 RepID=UPI000E66E7FB|nr:RDD family protein [Salinibius halmophilus]